MSVKKGPPGCLGCIGDYLVYTTRSTRMSMEVSNYLVSLGCFTYLGDVYPTYLYRAYNLFTEYHGHPTTQFYRGFFHKPIL